MAEIWLCRFVIWGHVVSTSRISILVKRIFYCCLSYRGGGGAAFPDEYLGRRCDYMWIFQYFHGFLNGLPLGYYH